MAYNNYRNSSRDRAAIESRKPRKPRFLVGLDHIVNAFLTLLLMGLALIFVTVPILRVLGYTEIAETLNLYFLLPFGVYAVLEIAKAWMSTGAMSRWYQPDEQRETFARSAQGGGDYRKGSSDGYRKQPYEGRRQEAARRDEPEEVSEATPVEDIKVDLY